MGAAVAKPRHSSVINWFETPLGKRVVREESQVARAALDDVFGFDLLQIGHWGGAGFLLSSARTQHATVVCENAVDGVSLSAELEALPFASDSIDAVVLPHTLECVDDPHAVLREAERVLRPEGILMILGFNPWSGWGMRRALAHAMDGPAFPPGTQRMLSDLRLRDWVALLGLDTAKVMGYLGLIPLSGKSHSPDGYRARPAIMCGAYLLKAQKRTQTLTLVRPKWRTPRRVLVPAAGPTTGVGA
jgi:SAM-dependent methyltransferase